MDKIGTILAIPDEKQRQKALMEYARSLDINPTKVKDENGDISENRLAVLIYDVIQRRIHKKKQTTTIVIVGIGLLIFGVAVMYALARALGKIGFQFSG
ncbi:MAG: hypothetical protein P9M07_03095 [Candidatus Aceula meridiana]|nr:hypothetical protein [Candidatus Aceula meridiana]